MLNEGYLSGKESSGEARNWKLSNFTPSGANSSIPIPIIFLRLWCRP